MRGRPMSVKKVKFTKPVVGLTGTYMNKRTLLFLICAFFNVSNLLASPDMPLEYIANKGQWKGDFLYKAYTDNNSIFLHQDGFTYIVGAEDNVAKLQSIKNHKAVFPLQFNWHAYKLIFEGAGNALITEDKAQQHYYNYFLGNDSSKWKSNIHPCLIVNYSNLYDRIDMQVSSEERGMKYDLIVQPGGNPDNIVLKYEGVNGLILNKNRLEIATSVGNIEEQEPFAYQVINGERIPINCKYKLRDNKVSFSFPKGYNKALPLVIDPTVVFATFSGSSWDNWGYTATYDAAGNFYAGGITSPIQGGSGFVVTPGAFQTTYGGPGPNNGSSGQDSSSGNGYNCDMAIFKLNATGSSLIYGTYIGGYDNEQPHSLVVDNSGNLIIAGRTYSANYPVTHPCFDDTYNGNGDMVITKLNAAGSALVGSTFVGGNGEDVTNGTAAEFGWGNLKHNYGDDARSEVNIDKAGNIYVAGCTKSKNFPVTGNAIKSTLLGSDAQDGVVVKMNANLTSMIWGTYLGGSSDDAAYVLALDTSETQLYVAGGTMSNDFPTTSGTWKTSYQGGSCDGFVCRFQNGGSYALQLSSFAGANGYDQCFGVQVDQDNNVYIMGQTMGGNYPVTPGLYTNANSSQFITIFDHNLTTATASTVFGTGTSSATDISPVAFVVDTCGSIYVSGWGGNIFGSSPPPGTGSTTGLPVTSNAAQSTTDGVDFYFIVFSRGLYVLQYATFMGGSGLIEHVDGGTSRFDKHGVVYQAICGGCGGSSGFPVTSGSWSTTNHSNNCNLIALKIAFNMSAVNAQASVSPNATICIGGTVQFSNASVNAQSYTWDFGDNTPNSSLAAPSHTYNKAGTFTVRMIAYNKYICKTLDTAYLTVTVDSNFIKAGFDLAVTDSCNTRTIQLTNTSKPGKNPANANYHWDFGDGTTSNSQTPGTHSYSANGNYTVTLVMTDPTACNSPDSIKRTVSFNSFFVKGGFKTGSICAQNNFTFTNTSTNATTYTWKIGDSTYTNADPTYYFDSAGTYNIMLVAGNPASCNKFDTVIQTITVNEKPIAAFEYAPVTAETNVPTTFTNKSLKADNYNWNFGDGTGSQETNPIHSYKKTGLYDVCLAVANKSGCTDTICKKVPSDVLPLADIPTAFSPNGDGVNDILFVRGAAVETMDVRIYNRWGELVFESNALNIGWDGTYKGKPQEMEAYVYVLDVKFVDGTSLHKKGNVTLIR